MKFPPTNPSLNQKILIAPIVSKISIFIFPRKTVKNTHLQAKFFKTNLRKYHNIKKEEAVDKEISMKKIQKNKIAMIK